MNLAIRTCIALAAAALPVPALAADPCAATVHEVVLQGTWVRSVKDGIVTHRSTTSAEAVTGAVYRLQDALDAGRRAQALARLVAAGRSAEQRLARGPLVLSPVRERRAGPVRQLCYVGFEAAAQRRFVSVAVQSGELLQTVRYEAVALPRAAFQERVGAILHADRPTRAEVRELEPAGLATGSARLPALLPLRVGP